MSKRVDLIKSNGWLVLGKPFTDWNSIKTYMRYLDRNWIEDCGDMSGEVGWHIDDTGILKAQELGYQIFIQNVEIPKASDLVDLESKINFALDAENARKQAEYKEKHDKAKIDAAAVEAKIASWKAGKEVLHIDERKLRFNQKEIITHFSNSAGSRYDELIVFTAPEDLIGVEGYHWAQHDYDTHYDTYWAMKSIADQINAPIIEKAISESVSNPSIELVQGIRSFEHNSKLESTLYFPEDQIFEKLKTDIQLRENIIVNFEKNEIQRALNYDLNGYRIWVKEGNYWLRVLNDTDKSFYNWLGILDGIEIALKDGLTKFIDRMKKAEEDKKVDEIKREENYKAYMAKQHADREAELAARKIKMDAKIAELNKKTKEQLLEEFPQMVGRSIQKSWAKAKIMEKIAWSLTF